MLTVAINLQVWSQNALPWQTTTPFRTRILAQCGEAFQKEPDSSGGVVPVRAELWDKHRPTMEKRGEEVCMPIQHLRLSTPDSSQDPGM